MAQPLDGKFSGIIHRNKDGRFEPPDSWMVFVARDNCLLPTLQFYYEECERQGAGSAQLASLSKLINRVRQWRFEHPDQCKVPDVDPGEVTW